jgi:hypothetical protein
MHLGMLIPFLLVLATLAVWGAMVLSKRRVGLASVFMVVAVEAAIVAALRAWFPR